MYMVNLDLSCNSISGENLFSTLVTKDLELIMECLEFKSSGEDWLVGASEVP